MPPSAAEIRAVGAQGTFERAWQVALTGSLAALGFFLPFSTAGTSLALAALLVLSLVAMPRILRLAPWRDPVLATGLALLAWVIVRTFAGGWDLQSLASANRYHELLMVPLLWGLLLLARMPQALFYGLVAGASLLAALHWLAPLVDGLPQWLSPRRISAGFAMATAAFLLFEHGRQRLLPRGPALLAAIFLALTVLFATDGRTGHLVLLVLLGCAAWRASSGRWRWAAAVLLVVVGAMLSSMSQPMRTRIIETLSVAHANAGEAQLTSTNIRVQLLKSGMQVARENYWVGTGWAQYQQEFAQAGEKLGMKPGPWSRGTNPHNEYLMQLGAGGLPALALFLAWLAAPMAQAARGIGGRPDPWRGALACVTIAFAVGCLFNSMLLDFVEGHLYAAVLALLLAKRQPA
jgi:O-antigen ligase